MYSLLMSSNEVLWEKSPAEFPRDRIFEYTDKSVEDMFLSEDGTIKHILFSVPCLFAYEFPNRKGARVGWVRHVEYNTDTVLIHFHIDQSIPEIPFEFLRDHTWELEIEKFEQFRHHWAIKQVDLPTTLEKSGALFSTPEDETIVQTEAALSGDKPLTELVDSPSKEKVFISYSHEDRSYLDRLKVHLKGAERIAEIDIWDDNKIKSGDLWRKEIEDALQSASSAILLVSADFIASDFIANNELPPLLQKAKEKGARIIPVIVKPCLFTSHPELSVFQAINDPSRTLIEVSEGEREGVFNRVATTVLERIRSQQS